MAATNEDIANSALAKLGAEEITSLSDTTRRARLVNRQFVKIRDKLLRSHPWNFAIKRSFLQAISDSTNAVVAATDIFTSPSTLNLETGNLIRFNLTSGGALPAPLQENTDYFAIRLTATTFQVATTQANAQSGTQIDITDEPAFTADLFVGPPFEYSNQFTLPSDYLRAIREEDKSIDWKVEGQRLVANQETFNLVYIARITDPTEFDESFDELLATSLAYELAYPLVQSISLKQQMKDELDELRRDVRSFDAQEGQPEEYEANEYLKARL